MMTIPSEITVKVKERGTVCQNLAPKHASKVVSLKHAVNHCI